ncbi:MAG: saccharopine dehydrogenase NADP-binding domain-containing protein [Trueperaceae bacterium]|nr:saccharopine dehydrogenase NADP-binding domain-containing protein [Trueperaceae bacterium]
MDEALNERRFDLVVWGATGYTGGLVAEAVAALAPPDLRWAVAGRDAARLEAVRDAIAPAVLVADAADPASLAALARATRAVVTTVGPYARYGTPLVAACVAAGTHVADLTGEPTWMRSTIERFDVAARASGVHVVHACGFDSVPSDLGVWWLQQRAFERHGRPCTRIEHVFGPMAGGVSGGTLASMLALFEDAVTDPTTRRQLGDRDLLAPGATPSVAVRDPLAPHREAVAGGWSVPFPMAAVNARVVRRTRALLGEPWGAGFRYRERWRFETWPIATAVALVQALAPVALAFAPVRRALARRLPAGARPDPEVRRHGSFRTTLVGWVDDEAEPLVGRVASDLDPGYGATSRMLAAMGIGLATDAFAGSPAGVVTPAVVGGAALVARLEAVGVRFRLDGEGDG